MKLTSNLTVKGRDNFQNMLPSLSQNSLIRYNKSCTNWEKKRKKQTVYYYRKNESLTYRSIVQQLIVGINIRSYVIFLWHLYMFLNLQILNQ